MNRIRKAIRKQSSSPRRSNESESETITSPSLTDTLYHYDDPFASNSVYFSSRRTPLRSLSVPLDCIESIPPVPALSRTSTDTLTNASIRSISPVAQIMPHNVQHWKMLDCEIVENMSERRKKDREESLRKGAPHPVLKSSLQNRSEDEIFFDRDDSLDTFLNLFPMPPSSPPLSSPSPPPSYRSLKVTQRPISPPRRSPVDEWGTVIHSSPELMMPSPLRLSTTSRSISSRREIPLTGSPPRRPQKPLAQTLPLQPRRRLDTTVTSGKPQRPPRGPRPPPLPPMPITQTSYYVAGSTGRH